MNSVDEDICNIITFIVQIRLSQHFYHGQLVTLPNWKCIARARSGISDLTFRLVLLLLFKCIDFFLQMSVSIYYCQCSERPMNPILFIVNFMISLLSAPASRTPACSFPGSCISYAKSKSTTSCKNVKFQPLTDSDERDECVKQECIELFNASLA